jgi:hypothetical protein
MTLGAKQRIFTRNIALLISWAYANGYELTFGDAYRSPQQAKLNSGKYGLIERVTNIVTWFSRSGSATSLHMSRLACDLNLFRDGRYLSKTENHRLLGQYWESLHPLNRWGGRFDDGNHYEMVQNTWRTDDTEEI